MKTCLKLCHSCHDSIIFNHTTEKKKRDRLQDAGWTTNGKNYYCPVCSAWKEECSRKGGKE